ncbi:MAG: aa3-type cytochrome c oxidase subunit IV [Sandarakinorhabdus sp.]|nr:aa3-type cytochrome c oxidase subunit IV [Sandarakinorhabdus sp.]
MANNGDTSAKPPTDHHSTYEGFLSASKWGIIFVVIVLLLLAMFLVH